MPVFPGNAAKAMCAAAALAAAPLLWCAVAHADPDPVVPAGDPRAECESPEFGGLFIDNGTTPDAVPHSVCQYIVEGHFYYDNYDNGLYTGTLVYKDGAKIPTERPVIPDALPVPAGRPPLVLIGPPS